MPAIRNTKKSLVERLSLKQESVKDKSLLERIGMNPTPSTELYDKLVKADPCWHKVDNLYFLSCPPELHFHKNKKLLHIKEYKELLEPTLDRISSFFTKMSENKTWAEDPQYDSLWKWFNRLQDIIIELDEIGHKLTAKKWRILKGACKRLKNVDFSKPATRAPEICKALLELNITIP